MSLTAQDVLAMPLGELRERVELAERLALASRLTPSGAYAGDPAPVNPAAAAPAPAPTRTRRTKEQIAADNAAAAGGGTPAAAPAAASTGPTADELMAAMEPSGAAAAAGGELSLDDIGTTGDDDMLAGFEQAELTIPELRQKVGEIVNDIVTKKDAARLAVAREALVKIGVQKASEVPDDRLKEFYDALPK